MTRRRLRHLLRLPSVCLVMAACGGSSSEQAHTSYVLTTGTSTSTSTDVSVDMPDETTIDPTVGTATATGTSTSSTTDDIRLDLGTPPDLSSPEPCPGPGPDLLYTHIWISNSAEGTVSRIDTRSRVERGRYKTAGGLTQSPSRTSVNLEGDVAVVNRLGSVTKIIADPERCPDVDNNGVVRTSQGPDDVLVWGDDECIAWSTLLPPRSRPAAWTAGEIVGEGCDAHYEGIELWTSGPEGDDTWVYRLSSETGEILDQVSIPGIAGIYGIYGGAVDAHGDFWGIVYDEGPLVHVHREDMSFEVHPLPQPSAYGMTVDNLGRAWIGGFEGTLQRYDPETNTWTSVATGLTSLLRGMTQHKNGDLWIAGLSPSGVLQVDTDQATVINWHTDLPGIGKPTGTSIDFDGYVWMVDQTAGDSGGAFVLDPHTGSVEAFVEGLNGPYTYSDMTGWALGNVSDPHD